MGITLFDEPCHRSPRACRPFSRETHQVALIAHIMVPERGKFLFRPHLNAIKLSFALRADLGSRPSLRLSLCMLSSIHPFPFLLGLFDVFFRCLPLPGSSHGFVSFLETILIRNRGTPFFECV